MALRKDAMLASLSDAHEKTQCSRLCGISEYRIKSIFIFAALTVVLCFTC